jgi:putative transposase
MPDHTDLLMSLTPEINMSYLVRDIKANSSRFINERNGSRENFNGRNDIDYFPAARQRLTRL